MGADGETVSHASDLADAFQRAKASDKTYVITMAVDAFDGWTTEGHAWWEVGTPSVSKNVTVLDAHREWEKGRARQRQGI